MAAMAISLVGTDNWNADVYAMMSAASRLAGAVKQRRAFQLAIYFWRINKGLDRLFESVYSTMEKVEHGLIPATGPNDPAALTRGTETLRMLHVVLCHTYTSSVQKRLNDNSILASGIARLHRNAERVEELVDWFEDMMSPQALEEIFANAKAELDRGETVTLAD